MAHAGSKKAQRSAAQHRARALEKSFLVLTDSLLLRLQLI
jgi:hypothetical protein